MEELHQNTDLSKSDTGTTQKKKIGKKSAGGYTQRNSACSNNEQQMELSSKNISKQNSQWFQSGGELEC